MPRQRKPPGPTAGGGYQPGADPGGSGGPPAVQAPAAPTGMPYGDHQASIQSQATIPLPGGGPPSAPSGPGGPMPPPGGAPGGGPAGLMQALMAAHGANPPHPDGILAPTSRTTEPVTAGLGIGAGPGPELIGQVPNPMVDTMKRVAQLTGDARLGALADQASTLSGQG